MPTSTRLRPTRRAPRPSPQRRLRYVYLRFLRLRGTPAQLSRGIAAGVFAGCFPLFGFQTLIGVGLAVLLRGNKVLAAASTWISNPLTYLPLFAFNYQIGHQLLGGGILAGFDSLDSLRGWADMGADVSTRLMLGSAVVGLAAALVSYLLGLQLTRRLRHRRKKLRF